MYTQLVPISKDAHSDKKVSPVKQYTFVKQVAHIPIVIDEFVSASSVFPICFLESGDAIQVSAILSLNQQENLFVGEDGQWLASYLPAFLRRYPFSLVKVKDADNLFIGIDEACGLINDEEGERLFSEQGGQSPFMERISDFLQKLNESEGKTKTFAQWLKQHDLLAPLQVTIQDKRGKPIRLRGLLSVDEKKLNALPDPLFIEMRKMGILPLIYAHMISLNMFESLAKRSQQGA